MGSFNNNIVSERNQRPSFNGRTILRAYFLRDGEYVPLSSTQVSSVMLFKKEANTSPSSILEASSGLVTDTAAATAVWRWALSGGVGGPLLSESDFTPTTSVSCSSVYSVGSGRLAVVLNGIDVWTVKLCAGCEWQTFINDTAFFQNNAVLITEPLLFNIRERLYNKRIELGSIEKLKIGTEVTIENKDIDDSVKNVLRGGLLTSGSMEILKHNDVDRTLPAWATVSGYSDTSALVEISGDNTFLLSFDTNNLTNGSVSNLGNGTGTYSVQVKYGVLDETRLSPLMFFKVV